MSYYSRRATASLLAIFLSAVGIFNLLMKSVELLNLSEASAPPSGQATVAHETGHKIKSTLKLGRLNTFDQFVHVYTAPNYILTQEAVNERNAGRNVSNKTLGSRTDSFLVLRASNLVANQGVCVGNCSRTEQLASSITTFIPLFVKHHKVGSGTVADVFRRHCKAVSRRAGYSTSNKISTDQFPWRPRPGVYCGKTPHEHASLMMYHDSGIDAFLRCTEPLPQLPSKLISQPPVRLYTVLREPVDKFLSAVYFWKNDRTPLDLRIKLKSTNLTTKASLSVHDVDLLATAVFWRFEPSGFSNAGPLLPYTYFFGHVPLAGRDNPTKAHVADACAALETDFTVGTTEEMDSFLVLVALENQWPLEEVCAGHAKHVNTKRPRAATLAPSVVAHLSKLLEPDSLVHQCAHHTHMQQTHSSIHHNFTAALREFTAPAFRQRCNEVREASAETLKRMSRRELTRFERSGDCNFA